MSGAGEEARRIQRRALRGFVRWVGSAGADSTLFEAPGVTAAVVPATPARSIVNSVVFDEPADLARAYDELAASYREAGVAAWSVWTPEYQRHAIELLTGRGHAFDGKPEAMTLDLASFASPASGDLDWDRDATFAELGAVNDSAYGLAPGDGIAAALRGDGGTDMRLYRARVGGEVASVLATIDHEDDVGVYFVATAAGHMRKGLAGRLLAVALSEARARGQRTSSLQSSAKGRAVYERLAYRAHFALHLYEWRAAAANADARSTP